MTNRGNSAYFILFTTTSNITPSLRLASRRYFCSPVDNKIRHSPKPSMFLKYRAALIGWPVESEDTAVVASSLIWRLNTPEILGRLRTSR